MGLLSERDDNTLGHSIDLDNGININSHNCVTIAGPCAVESRDQIMRSADFMAEMGIKIFRAGAFKPRTDPYKFQGSGSKGLQWLDEVRSQYGLKIISEVTDYTNFKEVSEVVDILQIGAKAMYNHALLKESGKSAKPVLLKRFFAATVDELLKMADYILLNGNENLMLCERGIRTFETSTRFTLDLCGAVVIKERSRLPLFLDPSHAMGKSFGVPPLAMACAAMGCEGLMIEVHPEPGEARCDQDQALSHSEFKELYPKLKRICNEIGRELV